MDAWNSVLFTKNKTLIHISFLSFIDFRNNRTSNYIEKWMLQRIFTVLLSLVWPHIITFENILIRNWFVNDEIFLKRYPTSQLSRVSRFLSVGTTTNF